MLHEEVKKYRELSGDTNPNTPISRIGGYLDGYEKALEQTRWIPIDERLPEEPGTYMTTVDYGKYGLEVGQKYYYLRKKIKSLPQVNIQPKTGHWEWLQYDSNPKIGNYHCSECDFIPASFNLANKHLKYCPNCGTRMKENKA